MIIFDRVYLDTNVLIELGESASAASDLLSQIIDLQMGRPPLFVTSRLTISELLVKPFRHGDGIMASVYESWASSANWLDVRDLHPPVLEWAAILRAGSQGLKLPDAIHLATALQSKCSHFMTWDQRIRDVEQLSHPFDGLLDTVPLSVIRPDEATLTAILESLAP